jgi:hypothetical protein
MASPQKIDPVEAYLRYLDEWSKKLWCVPLSDEYKAELRKKYGDTAKN